MLRGGPATSDLRAIPRARTGEWNRPRASATADIDLVLVGTFTPDMSFPSTACLVQDQVSICGSGKVDLQAACAGFMYALVTGMQFVATGCSKLALVIGADCNSRILNPADQRTPYPLVRQRQHGAVLLARGEPQDQGLVSYTLGAPTARAAGPLLQRPMGGSKMPFACEHLEQGAQYLQMDGRAVFKWAIRLVDDSIRDVLEHAQMSVDQLDVVVLHQANIRIINAAEEMGNLMPGKKLPLQISQIATATRRPGPHSLGAALDEGGHRRPSQSRRSRCCKLLISGFGAGLAWGTALFRLVRHVAEARENSVAARHTSEFSRIQLLFPIPHRDSAVMATMSKQEQSQKLCRRSDV